MLAGVQPGRRARRLGDARHAVGVPRKPGEHLHVVPRHDQRRPGGKPEHPPLRRHVRAGVERLRDGYAALEILVEVSVVRREHDRSCTRRDADVFGGEGVLAARVYRDAGEHDLRIAGDEPHAAGTIQVGQHPRHVAVDRAVVGRPAVAHVVRVLVPLQPDLRPREQVGAVGVVPVDVREDDVGHVVRPEADPLDRLARPDVPGRMPLAHELVAVEAGIHQDRPAFAPHHPEHHRDVDGVRARRAGNQGALRELRDGRKAHGVHLVAGPGRRGPPGARPPARRRTGHGGGDDRPRGNPACCRPHAADERQRPGAPHVHHRRPSSASAASFARACRARAGAAMLVVLNTAITAAFVAGSK